MESVNKIVGIRRAPIRIVLLVFVLIQRIPSVVDVEKTIIPKKPEKAKVNIIRVNKMDKEK